MDEKERVGDLFRVVIMGVPDSEIRHRLGKGHHYNPNRKAQDKMLGLAIAKKPAAPLTSALRVNIVAVFPYLKKHYTKAGKLKDNVPVYKATKPDKDNIDKFVFDALNGVFWGDDGLIVAGDTVKIFGEQPRTEIMIEVLELC